MSMSIQLDLQEARMLSLTQIFSGRIVAAVAAVMGVTLVATSGCGSAAAPPLA